VPRFFLVDAFTDRPLCGNPAVIVTGGEALADRTMRDIAAELRMEAGFVLPPATPAGQRRMRFFTPGGEVDVSGHVTVAAYAALSPPAGREALETRAGLLDVDLEGEPGRPPWVTLGLGRPSFGPALDRREVLGALRAAPVALAPGAAPRVVTCGVPLGVCAIEDARSLAALRPDMGKLAALSRKRGMLGLVAFARPGLHPQSALTVRFFFPAVGPEEDIVSGAALAAACAFAVRERLLACVGEATFQTDQGHSLGRPNQAHVLVRTEAGQLADVRVRGRGVVVASGELHGLTGGVPPSTP
jgi:trans-2,3-dihydro-3-hydroxyanthranilate isomerase